MLRRLLCFFFVNSVMIMLAGLLVTTTTDTFAQNKKPNWRVWVEAAIAHIDEMANKKEAHELRQLLKRLPKEKLGTSPNGKVQVGYSSTWKRAI